MGCAWIGDKCTCCRIHNNTAAVRTGQNQDNHDDLERAVKYVQDQGDPALVKMIELSFECKNLPNLDLATRTDPMVVVKMKWQGRITVRENGNWAELGRTQMINDNLNPIFVKSVTVPYHFEEQQELIIEVYDVDDFRKTAMLQKHDFIGKIEILLHDAVGAPGQRLEQPLQNPKSRRKNNGVICITAAEKDHKPDTTFRLKVEGHDIKKNGFLFFYLVRKMSKSDKRVFKSEISKRADNSDYSWSIFTIEASTLALYDFEQELALEVWKSQKSGKHIFIGQIGFTINQMRERNEVAHPFDLQDKNKAPCGSIRLNILNQTERFSFLDYVFGGCEISLLIGIDFTLSNKKPKDPNSLHCYDFCKGSFILERNEYIQAIRSVGEIVQCYDSDKKIPVFGFGAKVPGNKKKASNCFALNGNIFDPELDEIEGVVECYKNNLERIDFYGPTHFAEIVKLAVEFAEHHKVSKYNQKYFILLMITDGQINDMAKTTDQIVRGSSLPLSIIIVGVGSADFKNMGILDADETPLYSEKFKKYMERDIVQFVPYRKFKDDPHQLAKQTLEEVPRQLLSYFESKEISPDNQIGPREESELQIPPFFISRKMQFAEHLQHKLKLDRFKVQRLLNTGIPCEDPEYVINAISEASENQMLQRSHEQRAVINQHHFRMRESGRLSGSNYVSEENVKLSFDQEPLNEEKRDPKYYYSYSGRNQ